MPVIEQYIPFAAEGRPRMEGVRAMPAPPGTSLGHMSSLELLSELPYSLGLPTLAVVTPWAEQRGDIEYEALLHQPTENIQLWALRDQDVIRGQQASFGYPIPFVAILTSRSLTTAQKDAMWEGTAYQPFATQAVYRQDDPGTPPCAYFLHWGERIDMADAPQHLRPLQSGAGQAGGVLVFAAQVGADRSTRREFPATPFQDAMTMQLTLGTPRATAGLRGVGQDEPAPAPTEPQSDWPWWQVAAIGVASAAAAYGVARAVKGSR